MAFVTSLTIGTASKVAMNFQSQEVSVTVTYQLERQDTDLMQIVEEKAAEVEQAHSTIWRRIRDLRAQQTEETSPQPVRSAPADATLANPAGDTDEPADEAAAEAPGAVTAESSPNSNGTPPDGALLSEALATSPQRRAIYALVTRADMSDEALRRLPQISFGKTQVEELITREAWLLLPELQRSEREKVQSSAG